MSHAAQEGIRKVISISLNRSKNNCYDRRNRFNYNLFLTYLVHSMVPVLYASISTKFGSLRPIGMAWPIDKSGVDKYSDRLEAR